MDLMSGVDHLETLRTTVDGFRVSLMTSTVQEELLFVNDSSTVDLLLRSDIITTTSTTISNGIVLTNISGGGGVSRGGGGFEAGGYSLVETVVLSVIIGVVALVTIFGNTLVVVAFATDRKLRSFGNYFILNLAISDLVVGFLICVYAPYLLRGRWQLTRAGCLAFLVLDYVVPLASAWNMALISLDRYWSVARPIAYRHATCSTPRRAVLLMSVPWLVGTAWYGPTVVFWTRFSGTGSSGRAVDDDRSAAADDRTCRVDFYDHVGYLLASSCVEFVAPFVTVATINILIYVNIRRRSRGLSASILAATAAGRAAAVNGSGGGGAAVATDEVGARTLSKTKRSQQQLSRDKKSARSLGILILVFLVTWAPFEACAFVNPVCRFCIPDAAFEVAFWLLWLNSTINPMLYPFLQHRFRVAFVRLLCRTMTSPLSGTSTTAAGRTTTCPARRRSLWPADDTTAEPRSGTSRSLPVASNN